MAAARSAVSTQIRTRFKHAEPALVDDAALIVSELATNAVRASRSDFGVAVRVHHGEVWIEVTDDSADLPEVQFAAEDHGHGRGLMLVEALAAVWGVTAAETGKTVWAMLQAPERLTRSLACDLASAR